MFEAIEEDNKEIGASLLLEKGGAKGFLLFEEIISRRMANVKAYI